MLQPACFSFEMSTQYLAESMCEHVRIITHATSLGGVETLLDTRARYDSSLSPSLMRISVGLEAVKDLKRDLRTAIDRANQR